MPPPPPSPPQRRNNDPFDEAELRAVYDIHATTPSCRLLAASGDTSRTSTQTGSSQWSPCRTPHPQTSLCGS